MFDPAVLGTLLVQLHEEVDSPPRRRGPSRTTPRRHRRGIRLRLAHVLRQVATAIEPRALGPITEEGGA